MQAQMLAGVIARGFEIINHWDKRTGPDQHGNGFKVDGNLDRRVAVIAGVVPEVEPDTIWQLHFLTDLSGVDHRRDEKGIAPHEPVLDIKQPGVGFVLKENGSHQRHAGGRILVGQCVVIG